MPVSITLDTALDKSYENSDIEDVLRAPVDALAGVSTGDAFVRAAVALVDLGNTTG